MKIVINSYIKNKLALDHLLDSMKLHRCFKEYEIIVAIGGYYEIPDYVIEKDENIVYIKCNHNSIDFTGLIALCELYNDKTEEYYLYIHDTCKVGNDFFSLLNSIDTTGVTSMKLNYSYSMNMGIYSQSIINLSKDFLMTQKNTDPEKSLQYKAHCVGTEDHITNTDKTVKIIGNHRGPVVSGPTDYYNNGTLRRVEYYSNLDIYKIKANWGQNHNYTLNL